MSELSRAAGGRGRLTGKVALVTGVGSGIVQAIAFEFLRQGARVLRADLNTETAAASVEAIAEEGHELRILAPLDVRDPEAVRQLLTWVAASTTASTCSSTRRPVLSARSSKRWTSRPRVARAGHSASSGTVSG